MKGENGREDTLHALNALFEVLFTLCRGLAPFTPFLTDHIYLKLLPFIPTKLQGQDPRSVHFLPFPDVREELFDAGVERRVGRMQRVIELARVSRERRAIGLKTPLKTLVVIHPDSQYLEDVKFLETYVAEELNMRDVVLSADEKKYNVQYSVTADWPVLGKKLKKDMARVKKALPELTSDQVQGYVKDKEIMVDGIQLVEGDLVVKRGVKENETSQNLEVNTDGDVLIILDTEIHPELAQEGLAREMINRVQRLRKKAGLQPTDDVRMECRVISDPDGVGIEEALSSQRAAFVKALRGAIEKMPEEKGADGVIIEEEGEVQQATLLLRLLRL